MTAKTGDVITLSVGARDGLKAGMQGEVLTTMQAGGKEQTFPIATFEVTGVRETTSTAKLLQVGGDFQVIQGMAIRFSPPLSKPVSAEPAKPRISPTPSLPSDPAEVLRQANAAYDAQQWDRAAALYSRLLQLVPDHPIAAERAPIARQKAEAIRAAAEDERRQAQEQARMDREKREAAARERKNVSLYRETAKTYLEAGEWDKAAEWLRKIAAVDPSDAYLRSVVEPKRQAAEHALAQGQYDDAASAAASVEAALGDGTGQALADRVAVAKAEAERAKAEARNAAWLKEGDDALARGDASAAFLAWRKLQAVDAAYPGLRERLDKLDWRLIPPGTFQMGCVPQDSQYVGDEKPRHTVRISRGFWMAVTPTTVGQYRAFTQATGQSIPSAPGFAQGDDHPVVNVSWDDAVAYCTWAGGRLPTAAEWEYAARGGKDGLIYPWGDAITHENANYSGTGGRDQWVNTSPVGSFDANGFGLFDMAGNVWEWCADRYDWKYYRHAHTIDPQGPSSGSLRVFRGGSWHYDPWYMRTSVRVGGDPSDRVNGGGFRCVRDASSP